MTNIPLTRFHSTATANRAIKKMQQPFRQRLAEHMEYYIAITTHFRRNQIASKTIGIKDATIT